MRQRLIILAVLLLPASVEAGYQEAPALAAQTRAGKLPPVERRLPDHPVVVNPVEQIGTYGGAWRALVTSHNDLALNHRLGYETLMRWDRDGKTVIPGIAESVEVRDGARTFVFHLRKGMRWSDGEPFTSEDFAFFHERVQGHKTLMPNVDSFWKVDDKVYDLEAPDAYTVIFRFTKPYGMFLEQLAYNGRQGAVFMPAHYTKRFHPDFTPLDKLTRDAKAAGYPSWYGYYAAAHDLNRNASCPSLAPFVIKVPYPAQHCIAARNPYYWKVDPAGNQLPYIDEIGYDRVLDITMLNLRVLDGRVDFQNRGVDAGNYTLLMESAKTHGFRVQVDYATGTTGVYVNQCSRDEVHRPILADRRFRVALSLALNRAELIEVIYNGLGIIDNGVSIPQDKYFTPGIDRTYLGFDPQQANRLLDEVGLKRGISGLRHWPDGKAFREILHVFPAENGTNADLWQLVADYWRDIGLQFSVVMEDAVLSRLQVMGGDSDFFAYRNLSQHWALDGSFKVPIVNYSYHAPLFGRYVMRNGRLGVKPNAEQQRLIDWYEQMRSTADDAQRLQLGRNILKQWSDDIYFVGVARPIELTVISNRFHNVPKTIQYNFRMMSPGYVGIEQFYIDEARPNVAQSQPDAPVPYLFVGGKEK